MLIKKNLGLVLICCLAGNIASASEEKKLSDAQSIADVFYRLNGNAVKPKQKINHTKGFCASGEFIPTKDITSSIDVPLLFQESIPVEIRYSLGGAQQDDKSKPRGMALKFQGDKDTWTMVMLNSEINFAKNPQEFEQFFAMRIPQENGKQDIEKIKRLTQKVSSYRNFEAYMKNVGISSLEHTGFYSIHTFWFQAPHKKSTIAARWKFVPKDGIEYLSEQELSKLGKDFLLSSFKSYTKNKPIEYDMYLIYPNKQDATNDTTALWKGAHKETLVGTLKVQKYSGTKCNAEVYFPSDLPTGVQPPKDPLFDTRNATYAITFGKRQ
ncbi:catalase family peroxidase [Helicobacter sp. MIT 21-1697]|uniref:catalase family peroxidase n=1 Tax=Helicobacter sp. MIT 21-1697 TaxID=2993733 RepID=UPI00224AE87C|nr:catalase family peroxidase [Helicobacter sp. MIT 21-1697]MCX2717112.1 catalase family peroxidase [Helicobacter sp. MIT 21-1697]